MPYIFMFYLSPMAMFGEFCNFDEVISVAMSHRYHADAAYEMLSFAHVHV